MNNSEKTEFYCTFDLNLYNSPSCQELATQAATGRHLRIKSPTPVNHAIEVHLCEDDYLGWLPLTDQEKLQPATQQYQGISVTRSQIEALIPDIIAFTLQAMTQPNYYLWGGRVPPNYDCSGLIQAAFAASGIWLPRDSYQQEAFVDKIKQEELLPGDLIFFGDKKVDHVALYLGESKYIHSSGLENGRNGIAIDILSEEGDQISRYYYNRLWSFGRVMSNYQAKFV